MRIVSAVLTVLFTVPGAASPGQDAQSASVSAGSQSQGALYDPLIEQADEENKLTYIESNITFEYRHDKFYDGFSGDTATMSWLQTFGPRKRLAAGIEIPVIYENMPNTTGLGDIRLEFRGMLSKGERFEHSAGLELLLPSNSQDLIDEGHIVDGQTEIGLRWGCTGQLWEHTALDIDLRYAKGVQNKGSSLLRNFIESDLILTQGFGKRLAGYLEWDQYYEFGQHYNAHLLKPGIAIRLDRDNKWSISLYAVFPANESSRIQETKNGVGVALTHSY